MREVPEEESRSLTASSSQSLTAEGRWGLIRDVCQKHRGEVLEINGSWRYLYTPFPTEDKLFHAQYCLTYEEAKVRTTWTGKGKPASGGKGVGKPASRSKGKPASGGNGENTFLARDVNGAGHWREVAARWQLASSLAAAPASDRLGNARAAAPTCLAENRSVWCARRCGEVLQEGLCLGIPQPGNSLGQFRIVRSDLLCTAQPTRHDGSPRGGAMQRRVGVTSWPLAAMSSIAEP